MAPLSRIAMSFQPGPIARAGIGLAVAGLGYAVYKGLTKQADAGSAAAAPSLPAGHEAEKIGELPVFPLASNFLVEIS